MTGSDRSTEQRPTVFITNRVHPEVVAYLGQFAEVDANPLDEPFSQEKFLESASRATALMVFMNDRLDRALLERCPKLRIVAAALKGPDNFDVAGCTERGIWFTIVPDLLSIPTAELAVGLALGVSRNVLEGDRRVRSGAFVGWRPALYGTALCGHSAGIVGMGHLGRAVARRLRSFDMQILYADPVALPQEIEQNLGATRLELAELLEQSDFVFLLLPLSAKTFHLFDARLLGRMKQGSFLINVARGSVVDERAIAERLESGHLAGYAADVFEMEDWNRAERPASVCGALIDRRSKTLFTPHLGSAVGEARREVELRAARNIFEVLAGRCPPDAINQPAVAPDRTRSGAAEDRSRTSPPFKKPSTCRDRT